MVRLGNEKSAQWLERELARAVQDASAAESKHDALPCPGCGGPVASERMLRKERGVECPHCRTGLVLTDGGIAMPPARLRHRLNPFDRLEAPVGENDGDVTEWRISSWASRNFKWVPAQIALMLFLNVIILVPAWTVVVVLPVFRSLTILGAVALTIGMAVLMRKFCVWCFANVRIRVEPTVLVQDFGLGSSRFDRRVVPLARLVSFESTPQEQNEPFRGDSLVAESGLLELHLKTATANVKIEIYGKELVDSVRDAILACADRLRAMGRQVELNSRLRQAESERD